MYLEYNGYRFVKNSATPLSDEDDYETFLIDARLANENFGEDPFLWAVDRTSTGVADFKKGKYDHWMAMLASGREIETPTLYAMEGNLRPMDGRHRMMAMMDRGFEKIPVRAPKLLAGQLADKLGAEVASG